MQEGNNILAPNSMTFLYLEKHIKINRIIPCGPAALREIQTTTNENALRSVGTTDITARSLRREKKRSR